MARRKLFREEGKVNTEVMGDMVDCYIDAKEEEKKVKKITKDLNQKLKDYMQTKDVGLIRSEKGAVTLTFRENDVFDEHGMIDKFRGKPFVKTKEYIDFDELESALYNGEIDANDIMPYREVVRTPVLNIKK